MVSPIVKLLSLDSAFISYTLMVKFCDGEDRGNVSTLRIQETRIWSRVNGEWRNCHCHCSVGGSV